MFWRAISIGAAGLLMAASAQTPPQVITMPPESANVYAETDRALLDLLKNYHPGDSAVCSIPLIEVPVAKSVEHIERSAPKRILRPRKPVEPMPLAPLPAPPCREEKR
jgi:hypothetical protein